MDLNEETFARTGYSQNLAEEFSPTFPSGFKPVLSESCEKPFIELLKCGSLFGFHANLDCAQEFESFTRCKKRRDIGVFDQIRTWEVNLFQRMNDKEKQAHLQALINEEAQLKREVRAIPTSSAYISKRWRYNSDVEQLNWRMKYLSKLVMS